MVLFFFFFLNMVKISEYFLFQEGGIGSFVPYFSFLFGSVLLLHHY